MGGDIATPLRGEDKLDYTGAVLLQPVDVSAILRQLPKAQMKPT
jgi:hypothetical protein